MSTVSARRGRHLLIRRSRQQEAPPVFWGRIGAYEAVTRRGVLFLLSPEPTHPSRRVVNGA